MDNIVEIIIKAIPELADWLTDQVSIVIHATPEFGQAFLGVVFFMTCFIILAAWHEGYV